MAFPLPSFRQESRICLMNDQVREPAALYPLPRATTPHTWEDYARWEGCWELIHGVAHEMTPSPFLPHSSPVVAFISFLAPALRKTGKWTVVQEIDWIVDPHTTIRPDLMVARRPVGEQWLTRAPDLVLEVLSPSTAQKDRVLKKAVCQEAGVRYYILADPATRTVEACEWQPNAYQPLASAESLALQFDDITVTIPLSELWE